MNLEQQAGSVVESTDRVSRNGLRNIAGFLTKRILTSLVVLFLVIVIISVIIMLAPGRETKDVSVLKWFSGIFRLDFGVSLQHKKPVLELLKPSLIRTAILATLSLLITSIVAFTIGGISATGRYPRFSYIASSLSYLSSAAPPYWVAYFAIYLFVKKIGWFPIQGGPDQEQPTWMYFALPIFLLGIYNGSLGEIIRHVRGELEEILKKDYMQAVYGRGLGRRSYFVHAVRNAIAPSIGILTSNLTLLISNTVVVEYVFTLRGIGYQAWESASNRDYPVIMGIAVIMVFSIVIVRFFSELLCYIIDPRFRDSEKEI